MNKIEKSIEVDIKLNPQELRIVLFCIVNVNKDIIKHNNKLVEDYKNLHVKLYNIHESLKNK